MRGARGEGWGEGWRDGRARRALFVVVKIGVSAGLLWLLFSQTDVGAVGARLRGMEVGWLLLSAAIYLLHLLVGAWRWRLLLGTQRIGVPVWTLFRSYLVATFFNNFLPSNIGGDVIRIADTAPLTGSRTVATGVILVDRVIGLVALTAVAALGSVLAHHGRMPVPGAAYLWMVLVGFVAVGVPALYHPQLVTKMLGPLRVLHPEWVEHRLARIHTLLEQMGQRPGALVVAGAGSVIVQVLLVLVYVALAHGLGISFRVRDAFIIVPVSLVAQLLPISINGLGVREALFSYFFARLGLGVGAALALSLASAGLIMILSLVGGVLFLLRRRSQPATERAELHDGRHRRLLDATDDLDIDT
ncbi:MAG: hypothetical protein GEU99_09325 [Luteitalea sp.]|nr:hypothetical protein [Luteitalea sp.]